MLQDIAGETSREEACCGVAMSKDGMKIVVGSPLYGREGNGHYRGVVKVYEESVYTAPSLSPYKSPIVSTMRFQIKSSWYDSLCLSATFMNKLVAIPCITSVDSPPRKF